jgi:hypothetical protein
MKPGGIDSLESIPGVLKNLKTSDSETSHKVQYMYVEQTLRLMRIA